MSKRPRELDDSAHHNQEGDEIPQNDHSAMLNESSTTAARPPSATTTTAGTSAPDAAGGDVRTSALYEVMGVPPDATDERIQKAYKKLALQLHPDRLASQPQAAQQAARHRFQEVTEAFRVLGDPEARKQYDTKHAHNFSARSMAIFEKHADRTRLASRDLGNRAKDTTSPQPQEHTKVNCPSGADDEDEEEDDDEEYVPVKVAQPARHVVELDQKAEREREAEEERRRAQEGPQSGNGSGETSDDEDYNPAAPSTETKRPMVHPTSPQEPQARVRQQAPSQGTTHAPTSTCTSNPNPTASQLHATQGYVEYTLRRPDTKHPWGMVLSNPDDANQGKKTKTRGAQPQQHAQGGGGGLRLLRVLGIAKQQLPTAFQSTDAHGTLMIPLTRSHRQLKGQTKMTTATNTTTASEAEGSGLRGAFYLVSANHRSVKVLQDFVDVATTQLQLTVGLRFLADAPTATEAESSVSCRGVDEVEPANISEPSEVEESQEVAVGVAPQEVDDADKDDAGEIEDF